MTEENQEPYSLHCSACYTPCSGDQAHVVPRWNPAVRGVLTTYRCDNCWHQSLADLREAVKSDAEVGTGFCDFLARRGYEKDAATIRAAPPALQQTYLLRLIDALETGQLILEP